MLDNLKIFWNNHNKVLSCYAYILLSILVISLLALYIIPEKIHFFSNGKQVELRDINYFFGIAISLLISIVALINLSSISKSTQADFLLRIDERWGSEEIIKARQTIHKLYLDTKEIHKDDEPPISNRKLHSEIGTHILKLHNSKDDIESFSYLLNFLDFMETIGYFYKNKYIDLTAIKDLCSLLLFLITKYLSRLLHTNGKFTTKDFM